MATPHPGGIRPTLRQGMILILWLALLSAGARAMWRWRLLGDTPDLQVLTLPILVGTYPMPLLAVLIGLLDRQGPVRTWYRSACLIAASLLGGLAFALQDPAGLMLTGRPSLLFPVGLIVGAVCLASGWLQWQRARPHPCPSCGQRSVIPVARSIRPGSTRLILDGTRGWCACCSADSERDIASPWSGRVGPWRPIDPSA